mgnify:CR=1 FL=1
MVTLSYSVSHTRLCQDQTLFGFSENARKIEKETTFFEISENIVIRYNYLLRFILHFVYLKHYYCLILFASEVRLD